MLEGRDGVMKQGHVKRSDTIFMIGSGGMKGDSRREVGRKVMRFNTTLIERREERERR